METKKTMAMENAKTMGKTIKEIEDQNFWVMARFPQLESDMAKFVVTTNKEAYELVKLARVQLRTSLETLQIAHELVMKEVQNDN